MNEAKDHSERVAVLEHRTQVNERSLQRIDHWMEKMTNNLAELVRVQTKLTTVEDAVARLSTRLDAETTARRVQGEDQGEARARSETSMSWTRALLLMVLAAFLGASVPTLLAGFGP